jgi:hypothetical protein
LVRICGRRSRLGQQALMEGYKAELEAQQVRVTAYSRLSIVTN